MTMTSPMRQGGVEVRRSGRGSGTTFEVTARTIRGVTVIALAGELDLTTTPAVQAHFDDAVARERPRVVVDMARVTFVDSSLLHTLVRADTALRQAGGRLAIAGPDPGIRRLLDVFGGLRDAGVYDDVGEAVTRLA
jgi:anti-anti-sigma factor